MQKAILNSAVCTALKLSVRAVEKKMRETISIRNGICAAPGHSMAQPVNFSMMEGEQIAIVGPNASGKSLLVDLIRGRWRLMGEGVKYDFGSDQRPPYKNIRMVTFRDLYGDVAGADFYYQQRWHSQDAEFSPFLRDIVPEVSDGAFRSDIDALLDDGNGGSLLDKRVVMLSSGERRRFQIAMALFDAPRVLILDNPYVGLDAPTRESLSSKFGELAEAGRTQILMLLSRSDEIPPLITHVVPVENLCCGPKVPVGQFIAARHSYPELPPVLPSGGRDAILSLPDSIDCPDGNIIELRDLSISYAGRTILDHINLTVKRGEKWALEGRNGSGKSTLLSIICADNPQSYACDVSLFGRHRGSGESIWDIKKRIGYVSPEMCRAFQKPVPVINVVASGYQDFAGLYRAPLSEAIGPCEFWMDIFGVSALRDRLFTSLSGGEQRLVMLARAFVKNPPLLILDEPTLELDERNCRLAKDVIEAFCSKPGKTLIMVSHYKEDFPSCISSTFNLNRE